MGDYLILFITSYQQTVTKHIKARNISKVFIDMQRQEQRTYLPSALTGAPTTVSCPETEAAGAAVRVGGVKVEGAVLADVALDAGNIFLQIRQQCNSEQHDTTWT